MMNDLALNLLEISEGTKIKTRKSKGLLLSCTQVTSSSRQIIAKKILTLPKYGNSVGKFFMQKNVNPKFRLTSKTLSFQQKNKIQIYMYLQKYVLTSSQ